MRGIGNMNTQGTKSDFAIKFDRLYATQKYIAAFDLCIQNVKTSYMDEVQKKAKLVIPKLKGNLEISNVDKFTYDDIVDIFIGSKRKMKMKNGKLKISFSLVEIRKEYKKVYIACHSTVPILLIILLNIITIFSMFRLGVLIYDITYWENGWYEYGFLAFVYIAIMPTLLGVFITKKLWNLQHSNRKILRIIATALLKTYSNERV